MKNKIVLAVANLLQSSKWRNFCVEFFFWNLRTFFLCVHYFSRHSQSLSSNAGFQQIVNLPHNLDAHLKCSHTETNQRAFLSQSDILYRKQSRPNQSARHPIGSQQGCTCTCFETRHLCNSISFASINSVSIATRNT